ncbi:hypothetical protein [Saccharopolyspora gloriosae]|uniref:hypothetical protein n=1 Tax=Saccharopolyspora gloriosae TaxID=455344 RepID=UPI001FB5AC68|nr:hypothetical protein [Saccharopolyspora gloriosae]
MFPDQEHVWWIVGAGQRVRHAITVRPGARPAGDPVTALCATTIKLPHETWPATKEPSSRRITERCPECEQHVEEQLERDRDLLVTTWDA